MSYKLLPVLLLGLLLAAFQDTPYKGGAGDGFAEAELIRHTTAIDENKSNNTEISVYPNPVRQGTDVFIGYTELAAFTLIDINGNTTYLGENISKISTSNLSKGAYILQVKYGDLLTYSKIIVL